MIYKNAVGELWCECGNTIDTDGFYPVDEHGRLLSAEEITGDEKRYRCDRCGAIVNIDEAPWREEGR